MKYGSNSILIGMILLTITIALITNKVFDYTNNEGFQMNPSDRIKVLLDSIDFSSDSLHLNNPLVVENKIHIGGNAISLKPSGSNTECRLIFDNIGELGQYRHKFMNTGTSTVMPMFGVDDYTGKKYVNVATKSRGAYVKVSGIWPHRSYRFKPDYLIDPDLNKFVHSRSTNRPWNDVYLSKVYPISKLSIVNIHIPERLQKPILEFYTGSKQVYKMDLSVKGAREYSMNVPNIKADRVRIINPDNHLHLANLKIFTKE
jgi:hypothetical protein